MIGTMLIYVRLYIMERSAAVTAVSPTLLTSDVTYLSKGRHPPAFLLQHGNRPFPRAMPAEM